MGMKAQTGIEYLFFIVGGLLFVSAVVFISRGNIVGQAGASVAEGEQDIATALNSFKQGNGPEVIGPSFTILGKKSGIKWTTDKPSSSFLEYWPDSWGQNPIQEPYLNGHPLAVTQHLIEMPRMATLGVFYFRITSCIPQGECTKTDTLWYNDFNLLDSNPPAPILDLEGTFIDATTARLEWTAPGNDGLSGTARAYDIRYYSSPIDDSNWDGATQVSGEPNPAVSGSAQSMEIPVPEPLNTVYFAIKTSDWLPNWSDLSNVKGLSKPMPDSQKPSTITDLAVQYASANTITLRWTAPGDDGSTGIAFEYELRQSESLIDEASFPSATRIIGVPAPSFPGTLETYAVAGLAEGSTYYFAIKTADEQPNWSDISNVQQGNTTTFDDTPPSKITDLGIESFGANYITLGWTAPGDDGNIGTASQYDIRRSGSLIDEANFASATQIQGETAPKVAGSHETFTSPGLSQMTLYYFAIRARDENTTHWSEISNNAWGWTYYPDSVPPGQITDLFSDEWSANTVTLKWTAPGDDQYSGQAMQYDIRYSLSPIFSGNFLSAIETGPEPAPLVNGTPQTFTLAGLEPSTTYYFAIRTRDEFPTQWSGISNVIHVSTSAGLDANPPDEVSDLVAAAFSGDSIILNWTAPGDNGQFGTAQQYDIRHSTAIIDEGNWNSATEATGEPEPQEAGSRQFFIISGLAQSTTYYFAMKTADEKPNWSGISNVPSAMALDAIPPADITDLAKVSATDVSITLSWTAPGDDGNLGTATEYDLRYSTAPISGSNWDIATQAADEPIPLSPGSLQQMTIGHLSPATTYYFAVSTRDEIPNWSHPSNVLEAPTESPDTTPPAAILDLTTSTVTTTSISIRWSAPGDDGNSGTAAQYDVRYNLNPITGANWATSYQPAGEPNPLIAGTTQAFTIGGLQSNTKYYVGIKTRDEVPNESALSNIASASTAK